MPTANKLGLLVVIVLAAYVGYPCLTHSWLDRALPTGDTERLQEIVNFPAVGADMKAEVTGQVLGKAAECPKNG